MKVVKKNKFLFGYNSVEYIYSKLKTKMMIPRNIKKCLQF